MRIVRIVVEAVAGGDGLRRSLGKCMAQLFVRIHDLCNQRHWEVLKEYVQHLIVGHINLYAVEGFAVGFRYAPSFLVYPFFAILVFVNNDILTGIFAGNILRVGFLLLVRQPFLPMVIAAARGDGEGSKHRKGESPNLHCFH